MDHLQRAAWRAFDHAFAYVCHRLEGMVLIVAGGSCLCLVIAGLFMATDSKSTKTYVVLPDDDTDDSV